MINRFIGEYEFLSNFSYAPIKVRGSWADTVEHAFQAEKSESYVDFERVLGAVSPNKAKQLGRGVKLRPDWEEIKDELMLTLVRLKFSSYESLRDKLIATGDQELVEGNTWGDTYWGVSSGKGENKLGKILMQVREELRAQVETADADNADADA